MMIKRILLATLANLFFTNFAFACSCSAFDTITVSELVEEYDQIFRGKLLYFSEQESLEDWGTHIAIFEQEEVLKGQKIDTFSLRYVSWPLSEEFTGCEDRPHFTDRKIYLIFAKKDKNGNYRTPL